MRTVGSVVSDGVNLGVGHLKIANSGFHYPLVKFREYKQVMTSFAFCDYLGLAQDERVKANAKYALQQYGVFTAVSRAFVCLELAEKVESLLSQIFQRPVVTLPRTTTAHTSALPVVTRMKDALLVDQLVHTSVRNVTDMLQTQGNKVVTIRHNRLDLLEEQIELLSRQHERVWYLADGVYSMFGDTLPVGEIRSLMERYPQLHLYVDDAHGMSWAGDNGCGFTLSQMPFHDRMVMVTSLGKGFGAGGAAIVCPSEEVRERILYCGNSVIFSCPPEPPMLGAMEASASIHLSDELPVMQQALQERIEYFRYVAGKLRLPLISPDSESPIFFIGVGLPETGFEICRRMLEDGYHVSIGVYPSVPYNCTGMRALVTVNHQQEHIEGMLQSLARHLGPVLDEQDYQLEKIWRAFKMDPSVNV